MVTRPAFSRTASNRVLSIRPARVLSLILPVCLLLLASPLLALPVVAQHTVSFSGSTAVGSASQPLTVTVNLIASGVAVSPITVTQGAPGGDFVPPSGGTSGGVCLADTAYTAGQTCTVDVTFQPKFPGLRLGAVILETADGTLLGETLLSASATGSLEVMSPGIINTVAGNGAWIYQRDGVLATAAPIFLPTGLATDAAGNLFLSDSSNNRVRRVDSQTGQISTVAGNGTPGYAGDGGAATAAMVNSPGGLALDGAGNLYFADAGNNAIRRVDAISGIITTAAGTPGQQGYAGDGSAATLAKLSLPEGIAFDAAGDLFIADTGNAVIRRVDASTGVISTIAGDGVAGNAGDGGAAISAQLNNPWGVAVAPNGTVFIADMANNRVRAVGTSGIITTIAGTGAQGFSGDGGAAASAELEAPAAVVLDPAGDLYIADSGNNRVRRVNAATGNIETLTGTNSDQFAGDAGSASQASLYGPYALNFDQSGNLLLSDMFHNRVRRISASQLVMTYPVMRVGKVSAPQPVGIENDGNAVLNFAGAQMTSTALDAGTTTCATTSPLSPSTNCILGVEFAPTTVGDSIDGSLSQPSDAGNSPAVISVSGQVLSVEPTTVSLTTSGSPSLLNAPVTFTATVTSDDPSRSGAVVFYDGADTLCSTTLDGAGKAECQTSVLTLGPHSITAAYAGDDNNAASTSIALSQNVQQSAALQITASPNPAVVTGTVTLTLTASAATGTPTGSVTFMDGGTAIATANLNAAGTATWSIANLMPGAHALSAHYTGDSLDAAGDSNVVNETIQQAPTSTTLATSNVSAVAGSTIVLTATVTSANGPQPTGSVQWTEGSRTLGTAAVTAAGTATLSLASLAPGTHSVVAQYSGDTDDAVSESAPLAETIQPIATSTLLSSDANPLSAGGTLHLIATVVMVPGATADGSLTGTVSFSGGGTALGTAQLDSSGKAAFTLSTLNVGSHNLVASYAGGGNYAASTSTVLVQAVQQTSTTTTITAPTGTSLAGESLAIAVHVTSQTSTPTGSVTIKDGATSIGQVPLAADGTATFSTSSLEVGTHTFTAVYNGDSNYAGSTSSATSASVVLATASLTLNGPSTAVDVGTPVTLTGALTTNGLQATGTLTLLDGSVSIASQSLGSTSSAFSFATSALGLGTHSLSVSYTGDTHNAAASSPVVIVIEQQAPTVTALSVSSNPTVLQQSVTLIANVSSDSSGATGTVTFLDGSVAGAPVLGTAPLGGNGAASLSLNSLSLGLHTIVASYRGDSRHAPSSSTAVTERIVMASTATLSTSVNPAVAGAAVVFTAAVSGAGTVPPAGTAVLRDGVTTLATLTLDTAGSATFSTTQLSVGTHTLTLSYPGDTNYAASTASLIETVQNASTQIALSASTNPAVWSQPLTLSAAVSSNGGVATGTIRFTDGSIPLGGAVLDANGVATLTLSTLPTGQHAIIANYTGDGRASASVSVPLTLVVKQETSVAVTASANPTQTLSPLTLVATVAGSGAGTPAGSLAFSDGASPLGTAPLDASGHATLTLPALPAGDHLFTASYAGDGADFPSNSASFDEAVSLRETSTTLTASETDPTNAQQVTLIAVVHSDGSAAPSGSVTFNAGETAVGSAPVDATGVATITVLLQSGTESIVAAYSGDTAYAGSTSLTTSISGGTAPQFTLQLSPPNLTVVSSQHSSVAVLVSSVKGFSDTLQFGCLGLPQAATCTFSAPQTKLPSGGTATLQLMVDTGDPLGAGAQAGIRGSDRPSAPGIPHAWLCFLPFGALLGLGLRRRPRTKLTGLLLVVAAAGLVITISGCAGLRINSTPAGTYTFKVTASGQGSGATQSQVITLVVTK